MTTSQASLFSMITATPPPNPADRAAELRVILDKANRDYYQLDAPVLTDSEYDAYFRELVEIETKHPELIALDSPTHRVGAAPLAKFEQVTHQKPMISLGNAFNAEDIYAFDLQVKRFLELPPDAEIEYTAECKFDGLALKLRYVNGVLEEGSTRGDSVTGENVTKNVRTIKDIPLRIDRDCPVPSVVEICGEGYYPLGAFRKDNKEREDAGEKPFANPRNAAAGSIRVLDPKESARRNLSFFAYAPGIIEEQESLFHTQSEFLDYARSQWGLPVDPLSIVVRGAAALVERYNYLIDIRDTLDLDIDGMVIKVNDFALQAKLGEKSRSPRWATAAKFPPRKGQTQCSAVIWTVGRSGVITPVADLAPVSVGGVTVTRSTLHNIDQLARLGLMINDFVEVERAGDVIPAVSRVLTELRPPDAVPVEIPTHCPACGAEIERVPGEVAIRCSNPMGCSAQLKESIAHFCSRGGMDIEGLGDKNVEQMLDLKLIRNIGDIYTLTKEDFMKFERMGAKLAEKLLAAIDASKTRPLANFLFALGIKLIGEATAKLLANRYGDLMSLAVATKKDLATIDSIGEEVASSITSFFSHEGNLEIIDQLMAAGVNPDATKVEKGSKFAGQIYVFTGSLTKFTRDEAKAMVEKEGGKASGSVSKKTSFVVAGPGAGSKLTDAATHSVTVLDEDQFLAMLG